MTEYRDSIWQGHRFGFGTYFLESPAPSDKEETTNLALLAGWSNGCSVARSFVFSDDPTAGPENMLYRYSLVNSWFRQIVIRAEALNPRIAHGLTAPMARPGNQPVGSHEEESVPFAHRNEMSPMGTMWGYALPRIVRDFMKSPQIPAVERSDRLNDVFEESMRKENFMRAFLAEFSHQAVKKGFEEVDILRHVFAAGRIKEEGDTLFPRLFFEDLQNKAPEVLRMYLTMDASELDSLGIAQLL